MKNFSFEEQEVFRKFLFTNPHGNDSFVYPQQLVAGEELAPLMSAYSRTHLPMQTRVLQFIDSEKVEQARAMLPFITGSFDAFRHPDGTLKVSNKTRRFTNEYVLSHGHSSIKEETALFGYSENIADITGKKISGHPLNKPQGKSTRYISYRKILDLALQDEDLLSLPKHEEVIDYISYMNKRYLEMTELVANRVAEHPYSKQVVEFLRLPENIELEALKGIEQRKRTDDDYVFEEKHLEEERQKVLQSLEDANVRKDIGRFVLDYTRVWLPAATKTSLGYSVDARTLEDIVVDMISTPRKEDMARGYKMWDEAKKIAPILLGKRSHIRVNEWQVKNEEEFRKYAEEIFYYAPIINASTSGIVNLLRSGDIDNPLHPDRFNAGLAVFPYVNVDLDTILHYMDSEFTKEILEKAHENRSHHDVIHPAISHSGLMVELVMPYHGYRDIFRHRRGSRSTQLLSTRLGFEVPEIFPILGVDKEYMGDMENARKIYEGVREISPHIAEKVVPFGANIRALHSWQVNQIGYIGNLRSDIEKGNLTYVKMARELVEQARELMPITGSFFRYDKREYPAELWKRGYGWWDKEKRQKYENRDSKNHSI